MFLRIPYENSKARESAKAAGAKWQPQSKLWKIDGDCPAELRQFEIKVEVATYSLESLIFSRLDKPEDLLKAVFAESELNPGDKPHWKVLELVGQTPLADDAKIPTAERVQQIARELAARLLFATGQYDLAKQLRK